MPMPPMRWTSELKAGCLVKYLALGIRQVLCINLKALGRECQASLKKKAPRRRHRTTSREDDRNILFRNDFHLGPENRKSAAQAEDLGEVIELDEATENRGDKSGDDLTEEESNGVVVANGNDEIVAGGVEVF